MDRKIHAIITGDIVRSESIGLDKRQKTTEFLINLCKDSILFAF